MEIEKLYKNWKLKKHNDPIVIKEMARINKKNAADIFKYKLKFGTAGIRGVLGAGTHKINEHTISAATEAFAQYLIKYVPASKEKGIVIAHDNRQNGVLFSEIATRVMNNHRINVYMLPIKELMATPVLSYAIRKLKAAGGINITASHNPKEYNGFKVYNNQGAQILPNVASKITNIMEKLDPLKIKRGNFEYKKIKQDLINDYINDVLNIRLRVGDDSKLSLVYSPLHGTGHLIGPKLLAKMNLSYRVVKSQSTIDPNFLYAKSCNPEEKAAYTLSIKLARKNKSDIILLTDPDADRIGVVVRHNNNYKYLTGNHVAALYLDFRLNALKQKNMIKKDSYIVQSIVSSDLPVHIAKKYGVKVIYTDVGFKNIANVIETHKGNFIFGFEESYGLVVNPNITRDKDAFQGMVAVAEMANYYKTQNQDLFIKLETIYRQYGITFNSQVSRHLTLKEINKLMAKLSSLKAGDIIAGKKVKGVQDFRKKIGNIEATNCVKVIIENNSWIIVRPSGTEPKVKIYVQVSDRSFRKDKKVLLLEKKFFKFIDAYSKDME